MEYVLPITNKLSESGMRAIENGATLYREIGGVPVMSKDHVCSGLNCYWCKTFIFNLLTQIGMQKYKICGTHILSEEDIFNIPVGASIYNTLHEMPRMSESHLCSGKGCFWCENYLSNLLMQFGFELEKVYAEKFQDDDDADADSEEFLDDDDDDADAEEFLDDDDADAEEFQDDDDADADSEEFLDDDDDDADAEEFLDDDDDDAEEFLDDDAAYAYDYAAKIKDEEAAYDEAYAAGLANGSEEFFYYITAYTYAYSYFETCEFYDDGEVDIDAFNYAEKYMVEHSVVHYEKFIHNFPNDISAYNNAILYDFNYAYDFYTKGAAHGE